MNDDPAVPRVPKYKAPDFMRKEMALFMQARMETRSMRRNGESDASIRAVAPAAAVRAVRPIRAVPGIDAPDF